MKIIKLHIENYRGIKELDWIISGNLACLIGPGDSRKTSILEAIRTLLSTSNYINITESDFYNYEQNNKIVIEAVIGQLSEFITSTSEAGLDLCGWDYNTNQLNDEPNLTDELVIRMRFTVDDTFDPEWLIVDDRNPDGIRASSKFRSLMNTYWLGTYADKDLSITQGSALQRIVGSNKPVLDKIRKIGSSVRDQFKNSEDDEDLSKLQTLVNTAATTFGLTPSSVNKEFDFGFDLTSKLGNIGTVSLFDNNIPVRLMGEGSKRLMSMSVQSLNQNGGAIFLLDEIEHALEPYRVRHLIRELINKSKENNQVFTTTHSSVAITEFNSDCVYVVRNVNGVVSVDNVGMDLQKITRGSPEALLSKKIIVVEGDTEEGICIELDDFWKNTENLNFGCAGISVANGGGDNALDKAKGLAKLGYPVLLFIDADKKVYTSDEKKLLEEQGIHLVQWKDNRCTESSIFCDLPFDCFQVLIDSAIEYKGSKESIVDSTKVVLKGISDSVVNNWKSSFTETQIRNALATVSKKGEWYKRTDQGRILGKTIAANINNIVGTDLEKCIKEIKKWAYGK